MFNNFLGSQLYGWQWIIEHEIGLRHAISIPANVLSYTYRQHSSNSSNCLCPANEKEFSETLCRALLMLCKVWKEVRGGLLCPHFPRNFHILIILLDSTLPNVMQLYHVPNEAIVNKVTMLYSLSIENEPNNLYFVTKRSTYFFCPAYYFNERKVSSHTIDN